VTAPTSEKSIAVLPLTHESGDNPKQDAVADFDAVRLRRAARRSGGDSDLIVVRARLHQAELHDRD